MLIGANLIWLMLGIIGTFSIGYYIIPLFYQDASGLTHVSSNEISSVLLMSVLFFMALIIGSTTSLANLKRLKLKSIELEKIDRLYASNYQVLFFIAFIIWVIYFFNANLTSYASENLEEYFEKHSEFDAILGMISGYCQAIMAISIGYAIVKKSKLKSIFFVCYSLMVLLSFVSAQRLFVITPIFMLVVAISITVNYRKGISIIFFGIIFLMLVSPLMVFIREFQTTSYGNEKALEAVQEYDVEGSYIEHAVLSIAERADLLSVSAKLKKHYDNNPDFNFPTYLKSVIFAYVPKFLYPSKPYPLSDNGQMSGEASIQAWKLFVANTNGSLSAFGSITAYREGGWVWVCINGFLTGVLLTFIAYFFGNGGVSARILFVSIFVSITIKNVPTSFFYLIVSLVPLFYTFIFIYIVNLFLKTAK